MCLRMCACIFQFMCVRLHVCVDCYVSMCMRACMWAAAYRLCACVCIHFLSAEKSKLVLVHGFLCLSLSFFFKPGLFRAKLIFYLPYEPFCARSGHAQRFKRPLRTSSAHWHTLAASYCMQR